MTGLVRKATMVVACGVLLGATVAMAGVPSPGNSTIPGRVNLVGYDSPTSLADSGQVAVLGNTGTKVSVVVRDLANNPVAGSTVVFDFSGCTTNGGFDVRVTDTQHYQGLAVVCATKRVTGFTDATGTANFVIEGGGGTSGSPPVMLPTHATQCAKVYADNVLLGTLNVGMYNLDGATDGISIPDLSLWAKDFFTLGGGNQDRSNYDGSTVAPTVGIPDLSLWAFMFFNAKSNVGGAACLP